mmetsp:Transcript_16670/g.27575  ORF Transcript_16670/g.27575 Transcript_16670/m.27575 type:complete len:689 (+) Transcript_16670:141-2207(+)|eukprot:CAMPEP_0184673402 /NCGR_PEP_ID=MMETSP0308-20130426/86660_1 /TAXON_ID=38269 /ORGANISM="Gloeochaete witrockiana, Strain SAG 46.84" /LENGTH=688 /DNA_ID=CAMNT_0027120883 /DNA_START=108 /DNA_END=2174 /DNA_ORIENTATION=+
MAVLLAILSQGVGYGVVLGFGAFFSVFMSLLTFVERKYLGEKRTSESFNTAGRTIKTGLTASAIVSAWTWAATLLQSSAVAYRYGVSGPFWYASGASIQVLLFAMLAIGIKRRAPNCHTFLEIILARYGKTTHLVFLCFAFLCNIIVTSMLLLGGSAVANALTGMDINAASFLIPIGVILYVLFGGLRATFLTDYIHTALIFCILWTVMFTVYATSPKIGSPAAMFDKLHEAALKLTELGNDKLKDNAGQTYLTMDSLQGLIFGLINIVGNFGTVFVDQAYWQRAIAARPASTVKGYLIGGLCWFSIPFTMATTLGLAGIALEGTPGFPTAESAGLYMADGDVSAGLVAPYAAVALLGSSGAVLVLIIVFMAVTSAASAELIAVSSIVAYDIYKVYFNPNATGKQIVRVSEFTIIGFGLFMGTLSIALHYIGLSLGYVYLAMGIFIGSAVIPIAMTISWKRQSKYGAVAGALVGLGCGLIAWFTVTKNYGKTGKIDLDTTGENYPMLAGNIVAICSSGLVSFVVSMIKPDNCDWSSTKAIALIDGALPQDFSSAEEEQKALAKASRVALYGGWCMTICLVILWPVPMYTTHYIFSSGFFTFWVIVSIIWALIAGAVVIILPLWESRGAFVKLYKVCCGGAPLPTAEDAASTKEEVTKVQTIKTEDGKTMIVTTKQVVVHEVTPAVKEI